MESFFANLHRSLCKDVGRSPEPARTDVIVGKAAFLSTVAGVAVGILKGWAAGSVASVLLFGLLGAVAGAVFGFVAATVAFAVLGWLLGTALVGGALLTLGAVVYLLSLLWGLGV